MVTVDSRHANVVLVNDGEEFVGFVAYRDVPTSCIGVEIKASFCAVVFADNVVAFAVTFHEIVHSVGAFDAFCSASHGIITAPEFNAVENEHVGEGAHFINGKNPESDKYEFVNDFIAD